jgi:carbon-monoxide dehydrogenase medium subunit
VKRFELVEPATLDEAVALLDPADPGVRAVAGATALLPMMKARLFQPSRLISLRRVDGAMRGVRDENDGLRIGALTTLTELEQSVRVRASAPVMSRALRTLSNVRIRNVATLGGHLAHGDPHMDLPPVLITLGARVRAVSRRGERWIDVNDLVLGYYQTAIAADELIADIHVPAQPAGARTWYEKFTALSADDWPTVGVAVWYRTDAAGSEPPPPRLRRSAEALREGGRTRPTAIIEARVAVSAATERPVRVLEAEAILTGGAPDDTTFRKAADAAAGAVEPLADLRGSAAYKREMVRVHVRRALMNATRGAGPFGPADR